MTVTATPRAAKGASMARVRAAYDGQKTTSEIARELGLSKGYVRETIVRLDLSVIVKFPKQRWMGHPAKPQPVRISASTEAVKRWMEARA